MNTRPAILVVSSNPMFVSELTNDLGRTFEVVVRAATNVRRAELKELQLDAVIADARCINDGGHALDSLLEELLLQQPDRLMLLLTDDGCPETLERRVACCNIEAIRDLNDLATLTGRVRSELSPPFAQSTVAPSVPDTADAEIVLQGVTRQFETNSPQLKTMLEELAVAAEHDVTILLIGETGSGKTFLSRLIHEGSPRRNEPFLHVACGALPRELIETELFGHTKGAFTSAHADKEGKFVAARKGTVLLDEIDVLGPEQQVKLLKVIETGEFEPVGSNQTLTSQARLVVASNLDLQPLVDQGRFRPDLYYRLNMLKFEIPPLRKRRMDIIPLAKQFIRKFQERHQIAVACIDDSLLEALVGYPWPGNVRELENVIQRAVIYCRDGKLTARQLPKHILSGVAGPTNDPSVRLDNSRGIDSQTLSGQVAMTEKEIIEEALFQNNYSKTKTAQALGISRVTLYNKLKKYDVSK